MEISRSLLLNAAGLDFLVSYVSALVGGRGWQGSLVRNSDSQAVALMAESVLNSTLNKHLGAGDPRTTYAQPIFSF